MTLALFVWLAFILYPPAGALLAAVALHHDSRKPMPYILVLSLFAALAAYWYDPSPQQDLYRYLQQVEYYGAMSAAVFLSRMEDLGQLLFFLVSRTGLPHLLPALAAFVTYTIALYIGCDYMAGMEMTRKRRFGVLLFLLGVMSFPVAISVLRNSMAFALLALAVYRDLYRKKRGPLTWLLYLLPVSIHISSVTCLLLRLVYYFVKKRRWLGTAVGSVFALLWAFLEPLLGWLAHLPGLPRNIISDYLMKAYNYVSVSENHTAYVAYVRGSAYMMILRSYHLLVLALLLFLAWRVLFPPGGQVDTLRPAGPDGTRPLVIYAGLLSVLTLGLLPLINPFYSRFFYMAVLFSPVLLSAYLAAGHKPIERQIVKISAAVCAVGGCLNQLLLVVIQADIPLLAGSLMASGLVARLIQAVAS